MEEVYLLWRHVVTVSKEAMWRFAVEVHYLLWRYVVKVSKDVTWRRVMAEDVLVLRHVAKYVLRSYVEEVYRGGLFVVEACG